MENAMAYLGETGTITDTDLVRGCFSPQDSLEYQSAFPLYQLCIETFPNVLGVRLLQFYLNNTDRDLRNKALQLLSFYLSDKPFSAYALADLKPLLILCLRKHSNIDKIEGEADLSFLRNIVYSVTRLPHENDLTWPELSYCLRDLANREPLLGFYIFLDMSTSLKWNFLVRFYREFKDEAKNIVAMPEHRGSEEIVAAFGTLVYIGIQLSRHPKLDQDCIHILDEIGDATRKLLEDTVYKSTNEIGRLLQRNIKVYNILPAQKEFVFDVAYKMIRMNLPVKNQEAVLNMLALTFLR
ncbi:PREDICTED: uncharacterized protein LOC104702016 [Camelina sativa]|uniref:Uncharacterized protein LOC104702016 n=1 Tax=Camelina sativa TaxID=90675 RepID=A0ABM0STZ8_CAMSA|nr:PREDICTED: uncharacterized protein LOC104702016 [Camelina sativa]